MHGLTYSLVSIPLVEVERVAHFLILTELCNFRTSCKCAWLAAPFAKVDKNTALWPVTPRTVALAVDVAGMSDEATTTALRLDNSGSLTTVTLANVVHSDAAQHVFANSTGSTTDGNNVTLHVFSSSYFSTHSGVVVALTNHPRVTR